MGCVVFRINKARAFGWRCLGTETYHSDKNGKDYVSAIFLDSEGYRKQLRIPDSVDVALVERIKDSIVDVCFDAIATKDYSFLVFEGFYPINENLDY